MIEHVPFHADPILAAIDTHSAAWSAFQVAPEGKPSEAADIAMDEALTALLGTACTTRFGALALLRHLRWWLGEEAQYADDYQPAYGAAEARASDLTLFLGTELPLATIPTALPMGRLSAGVVRRLSGSVYGRTAPLLPDDEDAPGSIEPWQAVAAIRPDTAHVRALRFLDGAGEAFAALTIVVAGMAVIGVATLA
jgi:hypothetical protein